MTSPHIARVACLLLTPALAVGLLFGAAGGAPGDDPPDGHEPPPGENDDSPGGYDDLPHDQEDDGEAFFSTGWVPLVVMEDDESSEVTYDLMGHTDPARFRADDLLFADKLPAGTDLAPVVAGDSGRDAFFPDPGGGNEYGGQLLYGTEPTGETYPKPFYVIIERKYRGASGTVGPSYTRRLERWMLNEDGTVTFERASPTKMGFWPEMWDF